MGVILGLRTIDEARQVELGLPLLDRALAGDLAPLREAMLSWPVVVDEARVERLRTRVRYMEKRRMPPAILASERGQLVKIDGSAFGDRIRTASAKALARLLRDWPTAVGEIDLDKSWDLIHWFSDPGRRARLSDQPLPEPRSLIDQALYGLTAPPVVGAAPLVPLRVGVDVGYVPAALVPAVAEALAAVDPAAWSAVEPPSEDVYCGSGDHALSYAADNLTSLQRLLPRSLRSRAGRRH